MSLDTLNGTDFWTQLFLGDTSNISLQGLRTFARRTIDLIVQVQNAPSAGSPGGSEERVAGKEAWVVLMRENMWIATFCCIVYIVFVHAGPSMVKKPAPVKWLLQLWNLLLAVFSAMGSYHCMGALISNVSPDLLIFHSAFAPVSKRLFY
eukprot:SAG22_NODE_46_length_24705_cov_89.861010_13_plen_150_part_00